MNSLVADATTEAPAIADVLAHFNWFAFESYAEARDASNLASYLLRGNRFAADASMSRYVRALNRQLQEYATVLAERYDRRVADVLALAIVGATRHRHRVANGLMFVPRISLAIARTLAILPIFGIASLVGYKSESVNPRTIKRALTPILLIHGSATNHRQWDFFRVFLNDGSCGHAFSLSMNAQRFQNDKFDVRDYAEQRVAPYVRKMRAQYAAANLRMDALVLVGHSMGGMVAAEFALRRPVDGVRVAALVTVNTPWFGSWAADAKYAPDAKPEGIFRTDSAAARDLRARVRELVVRDGLPMYTLSGALDPIVPPASSSLPFLAPDEQIYSAHHDHISAMFDPITTDEMRRRFIVPNTRALAQIDT